MISHGNNILIFGNNLGMMLFKDVILTLKKNNNVTLVNRPSKYSTDIKSSGYSLFRILKKCINKNYERHWIEQIKKQISKSTFDYFIVFGYYQVNNSIVNLVKNNSPHCRCIIYFYDSFCRLNFSNDIALFDRCFTFDREDAKKYSIDYLPFFVDRDSCINKYKYDLCHIGAWSPGHLYRVPILMYLAKIADDNNLTHFFYCTYQDIDTFNWVRKIKFYFNVLINKEYRLYLKYYRQFKGCSILHNNHLPYEQVSSIESQSKCIVEINATRAGLSPRVINALANGQKIIINSQSIKKELFYNSNNIFVIDSNNKDNIDFSFLDMPVSTFDYTDLAIENWIQILLDLKTNKYN